MISILDLLLLVIVPNKINNITFADFIDNDDDDTKEFGLAIDNFAKINLATQRCQVGIANMFNSVLFFLFVCYFYRMYW